MYTALIGHSIWHGCPMHLPSNDPTSPLVQLTHISTHAYRQVKEHVPLSDAQAGQPTYTYHITYTFVLARKRVKPEWNG